MPADPNETKPEPNPSGEVILYQTEDQKTRIQVRLADRTVWLTQKQLSELFQVSVSSVNEHLKNIYDEHELDPEATIRKFRIVQTEGGREVSRMVDCYNLETTLAVGYRVRSVRGTQFRRWATERLAEYLVKGFVLDDERLKNPPGTGVTDHFDELLERIRDIRASERRMYLRVREVLSLAGDYRADDEETHVFFQTVQNKLHFAVTGKTAPELIARRADHTKPNMGLTAWKGAVVRKGDVTVAKNYLKDQEITQLNRIVTMFLDYAEDQAGRRQQVKMSDWRVKLDEFLRFNERGVLSHAGSVSREVADRQAHKQYSQFEQRRRAEIEAKAEAEIIADARELEDKAKELTKAQPKPKKK